MQSRQMTYASYVRQVAFESSRWCPGDDAKYLGELPFGGRSHPSRPWETGEDLHCSSTYLTARISMREPLRNQVTIYSLEDTRIVCTPKTSLPPAAARGTGSECFSHSLVCTMHMHLSPGSPTWVTSRSQHYHPSFDPARTLPRSDLRLASV